MLTVEVRLIISVVVFLTMLVFRVVGEFPPTYQSSVANSPGSRATSTLQLIIIVSRHGNRGFYYSFPANRYPINDTNIWPFGPSQLTLRGRQQMFNLGEKTRSLYNGFLDKYYYPQNFQAHSTLVDRTLQSGLAFLAGLYPPTGFEVWDQNLLWQPIPIYPHYLDKTSMLMSNVSAVECPVFNVAQNKSLTAFVQTYGSNVTALLESMEPYTGLTLGPDVDVMQVMSVWDALACEDGEGLPLPDWTKKFYPEPMEDLVAKLYAASTIGSDTMIKYFQGALFQEMAGLMRSKSDDTLTPNRRMFYYSGHDTTLVGLLGIMNQGDAGIGVVKTGSALIYELHKNDTGDFIVQALYIDGSSEDLEPALLNIPGCGSPCELFTFLNLTEKYYNITDYSEECKTV